MSSTTELNRDTRPGPSWPGPALRLRQWLGPSLAHQIIIVLLVATLISYLGGNVIETMRKLGINPGFTFLRQRASFEIGESLIAYQSFDSYGRALLAGLVNTIHVAVLGCILSTMLGVFLSVARLSKNLILSNLVRVYVEIFRNTPLLLQLFLWSTLLHALPAPRKALEIEGLAFLTNRGVFLPRIDIGGHPFFSILLSVAAVPILVFAGRRLNRYVPHGSLLLCLAAAGAIAWLLAATATIEFPVKGGFNITGGVSLTPEFAALLAGLVFNAAATISEIIRSGIQSVGSGQWDAGRALGLRPSQILRLVVFPQALRVATPLMTSSYLDLTKNSSLAVAIGFPDLVSVANTTANTTGQSLEAITILAGAYLCLSLTVSLAMNSYNKHIMRKDGNRR